MNVVGMISGTSADGIEAVVVELRGAPPALEWKLLSHLHADYDETLRADVFKSFRPETSTVDFLCALNFQLGRAFGNAALRVVERANLTTSDIDLIGSHGQTVWHIPTGDDASTLQLGEPSVIAEITNLPVVSNFRTRDMAAGGQGAPMVPYVDQLLFTHPTQTRALQNIGGIGNATFLSPAHDAFAFDMGPGNMLIDDAVLRVTNGAETFDRDGKRAAQGRVHENLLRELLNEPYLKMPPPKTTGRELFGAQYGAWIWEKANAQNISANDIIATVTAFTAHSIVDAYRDFFPKMPDEVFVSGGGAFNKTLLQMLQELLTPARVTTLEALGMSSDAKEAVAFAVLAYETWHNRAGNMPGATGAHRRVVLGNITPRNEFEIRNSNFETVALTEARNPRSANIDALSTLEMVRLFNQEDARVAHAVETQLPQIARAIDEIAARMREGGRLIYVGAGTSGRLGILDASECPPTYGTPPEWVIGILAGGREAVTRSVEGAEDDVDAAGRDLDDVDVNARDCVVGIAASGRTPYVSAALKEAKRRGALTISIANNHPSPLAERADIVIVALVGPEVITGSTRMKAGTSQKMILNMLSTGVMVRLGKTYGNLMVDVQPTNAKLRERAKRIIAEVCGVSAHDAAQILEQNDGQVKTAIVATLARVSPDTARERLKNANGVVHRALQNET